MAKTIMDVVTAAIYRHQCAIGAAVRTIEENKDKPYSDVVLAARIAKAHHEKSLREWQHAKDKVENEPKKTIKNVKSLKHKALRNTVLVISES
ncbi:MAG: hypothetical protein EBR82_76455 [Caulobacteraceae bacterium]|nr:hypothetical protein [Caulobacteraceae bacterium]